ncbi:MAG TPA: ATP-binding cassette domain-containing protein [Chloroflexota bacterium]|nr:ATP-binding cassette domain-containing protein [Chloroflexota bacterium]
MLVVDVENLRKVYPVKRKPPGFGGSLRALWRPTYDSVTAVDSITFQIQRGELVGFVGPNGAGKSTTIKMLTGILFPTSGSATVLGLAPWSERQRLAFRIASVFGQRSQLWYHLPPSDSFALLARIYEIEDRPFRERLGQLVERFGIASYLDVPVRRLSLGERMRCEIAAALLHRPEVVFLDEPTIGLDVVAKQEIRAMVKTLNADEGVTFLLTSHDAGDIEQVCRRVIVINHGTIVFDDPVAELKRGFLRRKIVEVKLGQEGTPPELPGVVVREAEAFRLRLEVDADIQPIDKVIAALVSTLIVADLTIEEPPLEEIIAAIYAATGEAASPLSLARESG